MFFCVPKYAKSLLTGDKIRRVGGSKGEFMIFFCRGKKTINNQKKAQLFSDPMNTKQLSDVCESVFFYE